MKQAYIERSFYGANSRLIEKINETIDKYRAYWPLSVRQVYYQLVAANVIPNVEKSYDRVGDVCNLGRLAGLIDWAAIEDRNRDVKDRGHWLTGASVVQSAADSFHRDLWADQEVRPFVIVEKAALAGVLGGICHEWDVPLLAARGYPSVSIVRELVRDMFVPAFEQGQKVLILHLGDHDPSGLDMTRDLQERISLFVCGEDMNAYDDGDFEIKRLALNMDQIKRLKPPPNPAKQTDSRFEAYRKKFGDQSWELDALEPSYLVKLVRDALEKIVDVDLKQSVVAETERIRGKIQATATRFLRQGV